MNCAVLNWLNRASKFHWRLALFHADVAQWFQQQMTDAVEDS